MYLKKYQMPTLLSSIKIKDNTMIDTVQKKQDLNLNIIVMLEQGIKMKIISFKILMIFLEHFLVEFTCNSVEAIIIFKGISNLI
jgi:hypothetical protein